MNYYCAHVCQNGHGVIECEPIVKKEYCEKCGAEMLDKCPSCRNIIREWHISPNVLFTPQYHPINYCRNCGKPYPWTEAALKASAALIDEDEELNDKLRVDAIETLPDLLIETPRTNLAVIRLKKVLSSAGKFTADGLRQFVIDFCCEFVKKQLEL